MPPEPEPPPATPPLDSAGSAPRVVPAWVRLLVTLAAPTAIFFLGRVGTPGIDLDAIDASQPGAIDFGVFALGMTPIFSAYVVVELLALAIPRWRRARVAGPEARAPIDRAAKIVSLLFALSQAAGVALSLASAPSTAGAPPVHGTLGLVEMAATWVAATALLLYVAQLVTRFGLVNGFVWLGGAGVVVRALRYAAEDAPAGVTSLDGGLAAVAVLVVIVATIAAVGGAVPRGADGARASSAYRGDAPPASSSARVWIPLLASSVAPLRFATSGFTWLAQPTEPALGTWAWAARAGASLFWVAIFTWLFQPARAAAEGIARASGRAADAEGLRVVVARARWVSLGSSVLFILTLIAADLAMSRLMRGSGIDVLAVALGGAILVDLVRGARGAFAHPAHVVVWEERRPHVVAPIVAALEESGVRAEVRGLGALVLLRFFAPFAPAQILVAASDREAAALLLASRLGTEAESAPPRAPADEVAPARVVDTAGMGIRGASTARIPAWVALAGALLVAVGLLAFVSARRLAVDAGVAPGSLRIERVADDLDPFGALQKDELPPGVAISDEVVPVHGKPVQRAWARVVPLPGEPLGAAEERARTWLARFPLPPDRVFAFGEVEEYDEAGTASVVGLRTYVLDPRPILTEKDVASAEVSQGEGGVYVVVTLRDDGARRFAEATRAAVGERLAIVVDDRVSAAPVVRDAITGGQLSISMGGSAIDDQITRAEHLAASLRAASR